MAWEPISEDDLIDNINHAVARMTDVQLNLWALIRIKPTKWSEVNYGAEGGGFWAVGIIGKNVIWFNDIEWGFNRSPFFEYGAIGDYRCNQDELEYQLQDLIEFIESGESSAGFFGAPEPVA